jgi:tRNA/rRNA methyltransferase
LPNPHELENLRVVLVSARNPLNIGAAARALSNFGFTRLRLVAPYDLAFREARSAVGASAVMASAEVFSTLAEAVADCTLVVGTTAVRNRELRQPLQRIEKAAPLLRKQLASSPVALLFGSEKFGLSTDELSYCHWLIRIPTREEHISMNLGQAVAICLYELVREAKSKALEKEKLELATAGEVERITTVLTEALETSGYINPRSATSTREKIRRLIRRLKTSSGDAELLLGMLRQIVWKLQAPTKNGKN